MSFLDTTLHHSHASTLRLPTAATTGLSDAEIQAVGLRLAIELLHDPPFMIRLNPLVHDVQQFDAGAPNTVDHASMALEFDTSDTVTSDSMCTPWRQWAILDKLPLLFGYTRELTYYTAIRGLPDGFESFTKPGSGVRMYGVWRVRVARDEAGDTVLSVEEAGEVKCNWFLSLYIQTTFPSSHRVMHKNFGDEWSRRMERMMERRMGVAVREGRI